MSEYRVRIKGKTTEDDGLRREIPVNPDDWWENLQVGTCPDCGGDWIWAEAGNVPGTRQCAGRPVRTEPDQSYPGGEKRYHETGAGCGSLFTVLGDRDDEDGGENAKARNVAVLRRERLY